MKKIFTKVKHFFGLDTDFEVEYEEVEHKKDELIEQKQSEQVQKQSRKGRRHIGQQQDVQLQHANFQPAVDTEEDEFSVNTKKTFPFPLIKDDPKDKKEELPKQEIRQTEKKSSVFADPRDSDTLHLPKHLNRTGQVYDVEVSGIRQLLEKRNRSHGATNVVRLNRTDNSVKKSRNVTRDEAVFLTNKAKHPNDPEQNENPAFVNPLQNKKRFVPTNVPSPIHGFKQPKPIKELMKDDIDAKLDIPVVINAEEVIPTEALAQDVHNERTPEQLDAKNLQQENTLQPVDTVQDDTTAFDQVETAEEHSSAKETIQARTETEKVVVNEIGQNNAVKNIEDLQLQNITIENSTVHIGQIHVEPTPVFEKMIGKEQVMNAVEIASTTLEHQPETENISPEIMEQPKPSGSKIPFNVVMLQSDKNKLMEQPFQQIKKGVPATIIDKVELRRDAQKGEQDRNESHQIERKDSILDEQECDEQSYIKDEVSIEEIESEQHPLETEGIEDLTSINSIQSGQVVDASAMQVETQPSSVAVFEREEEVQEQPLDDKQPSNVEELSVAVDVVQNVQNEDESIKNDEFAQILPEVEPLHEVQEQVVEEREEGISSPIQQHDEQLEQSDENANSLLNAIEQVEQHIVEEREESIPIIVQPYEKPSLEFLVPPEQKTEDWAWMDEQAEYLIEALKSHQINAQIESIIQGPAVTQFEITVAAGTKVSKIRNLSDDIKLALAAKDIRIDAPIPGKRTIGIEIPNRISRAVRLSEVTNSEVFQNSDSPLEAALGLDLNGKPVTLDLRKMPHGLIAGATGSGKSVCINSILVSLLYKADPHELKLMLIDPKMVELAPFNQIPHLVSPVITDVKAATAALKWAVEEMERRYELFMHTGVRDITRFNSQAEKAGKHAQKMPYILIVIDELADLMMMAPADVEEAICRIAQKARACGIHLIVATQRPSVDVITGLIKSNIPTRIAFAVSSAIDSRTILDNTGAERLLGRGDMLYLGNGMNAPIRLQGTFVTDDEIEEIIDYVRSQGEPNYFFAHEELLKKAEFVEEQDELFEEVCRYVYEVGTASTSSIQRRYHIGYNRAARLVEMLEGHGFVSEQRGSKPREVFITEADLENLFS